MLQIGNIYRNYIGVYLFKVIWSIYSSDKTKILLRIVTITSWLVTAKCLFEKKGVLFDYLPSFY